MFNHTAAVLALRAHLLTLSVCSTGSASLAATATGYTRTVGSFVTDGFVVGAEVVPAGFTDTTPRTITAVTATIMTVSGAVTAQSAAGGRSLSVTLPTQRAWENVDFTPTTGSPYVTEEYLPGAAQKITIGPFGEIEALPIYLPRIFVPSNTGRAAVSQYADAVLALFAPETTITVGADSLRVRGDVAPFLGQLLNLDAGFAVIPITIPLRYRTPNAL